ncbi:MAG TPA: hypothetical protein VMQ60_07095 [Acidobacteriaceae bacterium]|jgi:hypothetical protein|nr:hypothetical protein [Acidobacteriaceae bacterium]
MLLELAKPIALMLCVLALGAVFYTAFMAPAIDLEQKTWESLVLLSLAAGICLTSGLIFRGIGHDGNARLTETLPVQMFFWATCWMLVLFIVSWYLETHCIFFKDVRRFQAGLLTRDVCRIVAQQSSNRRLMNRGAHTFHLVR